MSSPNWKYGQVDTHPQKIAIWSTNWLFRPTNITFACDRKISMYVVYATSIKLKMMNWIMYQGGGFWLTLPWFHQTILNFTLQFGKTLWLGLGLVAYKSMCFKHFYVYLLCVFSLLCLQHCYFFVFSLLCFHILLSLQIKCL